MRFSLSLDEKTGWRIKKLAAIETISVNALMNRVLADYCEKYAEKLNQIQAAEVSTFQTVQLEKLSNIKFSAFNVFADGKFDSHGIAARVAEFDIDSCSLPLNDEDFSKGLKFVQKFVPIIFAKGGTYELTVQANRATLIIGKDEVSIELTTDNAAKVFESYFDRLTAKATRAAVIGKLIPKMEKNQYEDEDEN